jgi:hypothetical protein
MSNITLEVKLEQREKRFLKQTDAEKKKTIEQATKRARFELEFLARANRQNGFEMNVQGLKESLEKIRSSTDH